MNISPGGSHTYSADVLTENWFDQRLSPEYSPNRGTRKSVAHDVLPDAIERLSAFNKTGRTDISCLQGRGHRTNPIGHWEPTDPCLPHPPIGGPFETIYELTLGDVKWKNKPIPVGENIVSYPNCSNIHMTEHRDAFQNPSRRLQSDRSWVSLGQVTAAGPRRFSARRIANQSDDNAARLLQQTSAGPFMRRDAAAETAVKEAEVLDIAHLRKPAGEEPLIMTDIPKDRLIPTHQLGTPKGYPHSQIPRRWQPLDVSSGF